ncbi:LLM class flavin-dependent oxidoreductase [Streptomyces pacificus]|uniref:LLM class flavin-dependent oxidoreductase n=1 Tax=Streptomyces pacificus TaxID=2705029 RepID=UPI003530979C
MTTAAPESRSATNSNTSETIPFGEVLFEHRGEDVVPGRRTTLPPRELTEGEPAVSTELLDALRRIEGHRRPLVARDRRVHRHRSQQHQERGHQSRDQARRPHRYVASEGPFTFHGRHFRLLDCPALPKPVQQPQPPLILGGKGPRRAPRIAARHADGYNLPSLSTEECDADRFGAMVRECHRVGRGTEQIVRSCTRVACVGRTGAELRRRADAIGRSVEQLAERGLVGTRPRPPHASPPTRPRGFSASTSRFSTSTISTTCTYLPARR